MHLYPRRRNVAAQVADELKAVTYATPPMEERRKTTTTGTKITTTTKTKHNKTRTKTKRKQEKTNKTNK